MREPDKNGYYPLSMREYEALRTVFGAVNALDSETLKDRLRLTKYGWRDIRLALAMMRRAMEAALATVPAQKLLSMKYELDQTVCEVKIKPPSGSMPNGCVYVDYQAVVNILDRAIQLDCVICEKTLKECKRCQLYKDIQAVFPYELDEPTDTLCPFAGVSHLKLGGK